jgi:hypothetical protein
LKGYEQMKIVYAMLCMLLVTSASLAQHNNDSVVKWKNVVGVISAIDTNAQQSQTNLDNKVGNIDSGTFPWVTQSGRAKVNLSTGQVSFDVEGLVINGTVFSGTAGPVTAVTGTLVCNPGDNQTAFDTAPVPLTLQGDASFSGQLQGVPGPCSNPIFLIRIDTPNGAKGAWIATGVGRSASSGDSVEQ